jgi:hypothetical protein
MAELIVKQGIGFLHLVSLKRHRGTGAIIGTTYFCLCITDIRAILDKLLPFFNIALYVDPTTCFVVILPLLYVVSLIVNESPKLHKRHVTSAATLEKYRIPVFPMLSTFIVSAAPPHHDVSFSCITTKRSLLWKHEYLSSE